MQCLHVYVCLYNVQHTLKMNHCRVYGYVCRVY